MKFLWLTLGQFNWLLKTIFWNLCSKHEVISLHLADLSLLYSSVLMCYNITSVLVSMSTSGHSTSCPMRTVVTWWLWFRVLQFVLHYGRKHEVHAERIENLWVLFWYLSLSCKVSFIDWMCWRLNCIGDWIVLSLTHISRDLVWFYHSWENILQNNVCFWIVSVLTPPQMVLYHNIHCYIFYNLFCFYQALLFRNVWTTWLITWFNVYKERYK